MSGSGRDEDAPPAWYCLIRDLPVKDQIAELVERIHNLEKQFSCVHEWVSTEASIRDRRPDRVPVEICRKCGMLRIAPGSTCLDNRTPNVGEGWTAVGSVRGPESGKERGR